MKASYMNYRYEVKFLRKDGITFAGSCDLDDSLADINKIRTAVRKKVEEKYGAYFNVKKDAHYLLILNEYDEIILEWKKKEKKEKK